jgi:lipoprotein NlpD
MMFQLRFVLLSLLLLAGCGSQPVSAPVDSRSNQSTTGAAAQARPSPATRKQVSADATYYVVHRGDTLYSIAWQHGLTYRQLADINGIRAPYTIYSGQRLRVKPLAAQRTAAPVQSKPRTTPAVRQPQPVASRKTTAPAGKPAAAVSGSVAGYDGKWVWPTRGRVQRGFQADANGRKGIDIGGHSNQPVNAAANGKVVYAGSGLVGYGRLIIVKHNENLLSAYGHNNKLLVAEGEYVKAGQMIATMGSSGTSRTGLYFEIRKNGKPVNPLQYLPRQ